MPFRLSYLIGFCSFCILTACQDSNLFYQDDHVIESGKWAYEDQANFSVEIPDTVSYYDLILEIDHDAEFSFQNIYMEIKTQFPDGKSNEDLISLELADKTGRWIGKCNSKKCVAPFRLKENIRFSQKGNHRFTLTQHTRESNLTGIHKIGMQLISAD